MKNLLLSITLVLSSIATLSVHSQEWKTLDDEVFSIEYPETWEINTSGVMGTKFIMFSPLTSENDAFRENVNFLIQDLSGKKINLNQYVEVSETQVKTLLNNSEIIESKRVKNKKQTYHKLIYTGEQGEFELHFEQYFFIVDDHAYVLTFSCEMDQLEDFQETGERIMNSFLLK